MEIKIPKLVTVNGLPAGYEDAIKTDTDIHFVFLDKVKILFGYRVMLWTKTYCEHRPGKVYSEGGLRIYRPRKHAGACAEEGLKDGKERKR